MYVAMWDVLGRSALEDPGPKEGGQDDLQFREEEEGPSSIVHDDHEMARYTREW